MSVAHVVQIGRDLLTTAILVAAPAVLVSMLVGVIISILQTITSIQEQTLTFAPRIVAVSVVMILTLPWCLRLLIAFTLRMMELAAQATS